MEQNQGVLEHWALLLLHEILLQYVIGHRMGDTYSGCRTSGRHLRLHEDLGLLPETACLYS